MRMLVVDRLFNPTEYIKYSNFRDSIIVTPSSYGNGAFNLVELCISVKGADSVDFTLLNAYGKELQDVTVSVKLTFVQLSTLITLCMLTIFCIITYYNILQTSCIHI